MSIAYGAGMDMGDAYKEVMDLISADKLDILKLKPPLE